MITAVWDYSPSNVFNPLLAEIEADYTRWLKKYYPKAVSKPMAVYHGELWDWVWQIELDKPHPEFDAFFGIWPRRGGEDNQWATSGCGARCKEEKKIRLVTLSNASPG